MGIELTGSGCVCVNICLHLRYEYGRGKLDAIAQDRRLGLCSRLHMATAVSDDPEQNRASRRLTATARYEAATNGATQSAVSSCACVDQPPSDTLAVDSTAIVGDTSDMPHSPMLHTLDAM